jgi:predicted negative regulator of RcsB-dependent stress response
MSSSTLSGDGLFFRALSLASDQPEQACRDLRELLTQARWTRREQACGGLRLITAGDILLRNGDFAWAKRAYDLVPESTPEQASARNEMVDLLLALRSGETAAISKIDDVNGDGYWKPVIACLGLLVTDVAVARKFVTRAEQRGAPAALVRVLSAITEKTEISEADLNSLPTPPGIVEKLRLMHGEGPETDRLDSFSTKLNAETLRFDPGESEAATAKLLARWCELGQWDRALQTAHELLQSDQTWSRGLATLVAVRHALVLATQGDLDTAEQELNALAKVI